MGKVSITTSEINQDERQYLRQMFCLLMRKDRTNQRLRLRERTPDNLVARFYDGENQIQ